LRRSNRRNKERESTPSSNADFSRCTSPPSRAGRGASRVARLALVDQVRVDAFLGFWRPPFLHVGRSRERDRRHAVQNSDPPSSPSNFPRPPTPLNNSAWPQADVPGAGESSDGARRRDVWPPSSSGGGATTRRRRAREVAPPPPRHHRGSPKPSRLPRARGGERARGGRASTGWRIGRGEVSFRKGRPKRVTLPVPPPSPARRPLSKAHPSPGGSHVSVLGAPLRARALAPEPRTPPRQVSLATGARARALGGHPARFAAGPRPFADVPLTPLPPRDEKTSTS
jgi:hypothetical protein